MLASVFFHKPYFQNIAFLDSSDITITAARKMKWKRFRYSTYITYSIGGSVVECSPATRAARVWFPADTGFFFLNLISFLVECSPATRAARVRFTADAGFFLKSNFFPGRMLACHAGGPGSIPGRCRIFFFKSNFFAGRILACHAGSPGSIHGRCRIFFKILFLSW